MTRANSQIFSQPPASLLPGRSSAAGNPAGPHISDVFDQTQSHDIVGCATNYMLQNAAGHSEYALNTPKIFYYQASECFGRTPELQAQQRPKKGTRMDIKTSSHTLGPGER